MQIQEIISQWGSPVYAVVIFFGGRWGVKFFNPFIQKKHNFLLFASIFGLLFIGAEVVLKTFKPGYFIGYLLTYAVVTSCYEMLSDWFPFLKGKE